MFNLGKITKKLIISIGFWLLILGFTNASRFEKVDIAEYEKEITSLFESMRRSQDDFEKLEINKEVIAVFSEMLSIDSSFYFPFDSLKYLGKIYSPDRFFRLYSWNVPMGDVTHRYFGYIQYIQPESNQVKVLFLDDSKNSRLSTDLIYAPADWYGALYYDIIKTECSGKKYYTVLGFVFNNYLTSYKIIDVISFEREGISIGAEIFPQGETNKYRMIHEFSSKVSMMLRYDKELEMIVFDHLSPAQPEYENQFQFYGPDSSYDGLEFRNCVWTLHEDLNLINKMNK